MMSSARLVPPGLALIAVTYGLARFAYGLFLPDMRAAFDLPPALLGVIGAGSYVGYCAAIVVALAFTSRTGPRLMAVAAGAVAVVGMATVAAAAWSPRRWARPSRVRSATTCRTGPTPSSTQAPARGLRSPDRRR